MGGFWAVDKNAVQDVGAVLPMGMIGPAMTGRVAAETPAGIFASKPSLHVQAGCKVQQEEDLQFASHPDRARTWLLITRTVECEAWDM